jgi:hypothetical protein
VSCGRRALAELQRGQQVLLLQVRVVGEHVVDAHPG